MIEADRVVLSTPGADGLGEVVRALRAWQYEGAPMQLHPGDLGWHWRFGPEATAASTRTWSRDGRILAVGLVDSDSVRLAVAPDARNDEPLAQTMSRDVTQPERAGFASGNGGIEARWGGPFEVRLARDGWGPGEPWTPLSRVLGGRVEDGRLRTEVIGPEQARVRAAVQRASFDRSTFTDDRWHAMAAGLPYADARCLVAYDDQGAAVAAATVWSAGRDKPGLIEPLGVHRAHRGHGYGTAIASAAAAALQRMGSSSAVVCTPSSNIAAVATYRSAGFRALHEVRDLHRRTERADRSRGEL